VDAESESESVPGSGDAISAAAGSAATGSDDGAGSRSDVGGPHDAAEGPVSADGVSDGQGCVGLSAPGAAAAGAGAAARSAASTPVSVGSPPTFSPAGSFGLRGSVI
jgi:hypothetical protein